MVVDAQIHGRARFGESCSGDAGLIHQADAITWVLLVDGLGHGPKAAEAATRAIEQASSFTAELSVERGLRMLHEQLGGTRGAAAALARFDQQGVTLAGVGNVEIRSLGERSIPYVPVNGVLGGRMRTVRSTSTSLSRGDRLLFYTDGIARRTPFAKLAGLDVPSLCTALIEEHSHPHDDATLIHLTYLG